MKNKYLTMIGHPTGRLLLGRGGFALDMDEITNAARDYGVVIELNANPHRLDIDWRYHSLARAKGVKVSINPDAHSIDGYECMRFGVGIARKGWLEKKDVFNTLGLVQAEKLLEKG